MKRILRKRRHKMNATGNMVPVYLPDGVKARLMVVTVIGEDGNCYILGPPDREGKNDPRVWGSILSAGYQALIGMAMGMNNNVEESRIIKPDIHLGKLEKV
jgi:hypothetical protein